MKNFIRKIFKKQQKFIQKLFNLKGKVYYFPIEEDVIKTFIHINQLIQILNNQYNWMKKILKDIYYQVKFQLKMENRQNKPNRQNKQYRYSKKLKNYVF